MSDHEKLAEIRGRFERASEGLWDAYQTGNTWSIGNVRQGIFDGCEQLADAMFVVYARADIPWLLGKIERLQAEVVRLTAAGRSEELSISKVRCCKNCFHESRGLCLRTPTTDGKLEYKRSLAYVSNWNPGRLYVAPNFYCVQYQQFRFTDDTTVGAEDTCQRDRSVL